MGRFRLLQLTTTVGEAVYRADAGERLVVGVVGQVDATSVGFVAHGVAGVDDDLAEMTVLTEHVLTTQILLRCRLQGNADDVDQILLYYSDHLKIVSVLLLI